MRGEEEERIDASACANRENDSIGIRDSSFAIASSTNHRFATSTFPHTPIAKYSEGRHRIEPTHHVDERRQLADAEHGRHRRVLPIVVVAPSVPTRNLEEEVQPRVVVRASHGDGIIYPGVRRVGGAGGRQMRDERFDGRWPIVRVSVEKQGGGGRVDGVASYRCDRGALLG